MLDDPDELSSLKDQFDRLVRNEGSREDGIEHLCDHEIRRRFAKWINRAAKKDEAGNYAWQWDQA